MANGIARYWNGDNIVSEFYANKETIAQSFFHLVKMNLIEDNLSVTFCEIITPENQKEYMLQIDSGGYSWHRVRIASLIPFVENQ